MSQFDVRRGKSNHELLVCPLLVKSSQCNLVIESEAGTDPLEPVGNVRNPMSTARRKWPFASALVVFFASMVSANPLAGINNDPSARLLFAMDPFENPISHSYSLGDAKEKVLRRFGEPSEMTISTQGTRWPGETQTSYRLTYNDVRFVVNRTNNQPST